MSDTPSPVVREAREHAELAIECLADVPRDHTGDLNYEKGATAIRALESAVERLDRELAEARRMLADAAKIAANVVASERERDEARAEADRLREAGRAFIATTSVFRQPKDSRDAFFYLAQLLVDPDTAALRGTDE